MNETYFHQTIRIEYLFHRTEYLNVIKSMTLSISLISFCNRYFRNNICKFVNGNLTILQ